MDRLCTYKSNDIHKFYDRTPWDLNRRPAGEKTHYQLCAILVTDLTIGHVHEITNIFMSIL